MKSFGVAVVALAALTGTAFAQPTPPTVTISLANDQVGTNGAAPVQIGGIGEAIISIFFGTPISQNGQILATSAQLTAGVAICDISDGNGNVVGTISEQSTFVSFGPQPIDLSQGSIICDP